MVNRPPTHLFLKNPIPILLPAVVPNHRVELSHQQLQNQTWFRFLETLPPRRPLKAPVQPIALLALQRVALPLSTQKPLHPIDHLEVRTLTRPAKPAQLHRENQPANSTTNDQTHRPKHRRSLTLQVQTREPIAGSEPTSVLLPGPVDLVDLERFRRIFPANDSSKVFRHLH